MLFNTWILKIPNFEYRSLFHRAILDIFIYYKHKVAYFDHMIWAIISMPIMNGPSMGTKFWWSRWPGNT